MDKKIFALRLTTLRKRGGKTQEEVAKDLGIARGRYSNYEQGTRELDLEMLKKIANYYNTTSDYIIGNDLTQEELDKLNIDAARMTIENVTPEEIEKALELIRLSKK